jgi:AcrR family transcriptional regulator
MLFLAYTHWREALRKGSFVLLIQQKMKTKQVVAVIGFNRNGLIRNEMKNNIKESIKEKARELFFSYGIKSVSMDDVAKKAGVSKRTIYEFFEDKNELVNEIVQDPVRSYSNLFRSSQSTAEDAIDEVIKQNDELLGIWTKIRPGFFVGLERTFPEISEQLEQYKLIIRKGIMSNLRRGKEEGNYRDDIDVALVSDLRFHQLMNVMKPNLLTSHELNITQLAGEFTILYLHAITTEKGKKLLDNYLNKAGCPHSASDVKSVNINNESI